jgi:hypothetical protein
MAPPRGHVRYGGRKKGSPNKRQRALHNAIENVVRKAASSKAVAQQAKAAEVASILGDDDDENLPLGYMLSLMRDKTQPETLRLDAAKSAAPYLHARLNAIEARVLTQTSEPRFSAKARAARDAIYSAAGDVYGAAYAEAEQLHYDRLAAIRRHFGQQVTNRGDPDADHALVFVETLADPRVCMRRNQSRLFERSSRRRPGCRDRLHRDQALGFVDANGRVVAENSVSEDG